MKSNLTTTLMLTCCVTLPGARTVAADASACTKLEDNAARLQCYDEALKPTRPAEAQTGRNAPAAATSSVTPASAAAPPPSQTTTGSVAAAAPSAPVSHSQATSEVASFGASQPKEPVQRIEAHLRAIQAAAYGEKVITLDNDQVWRVTQWWNDPFCATGDAIVIRRATMGSFLMTCATENGSVRVRRIN